MTSDLEFAYKDPLLSRHAYSASGKSITMLLWLIKSGGSLAQHQLLPALIANAPGAPS
jgi:hypothetical protein